MPARLYVVHGSHPCAAGARAMDMKGFAYSVVEALAPQPPLFPADVEARAAVEAAEAWADEVWQQVARRVTWGAFARAPRSMPSYQDGTRLPRLPAPAVIALAPVVGAVERRLNAASPDRVRADLQALPEYLDRIDAWIADGVIGGDAVNAADLQIASSSRLMLTFGDVQTLFAGRPAEAHAMALFPEWPGAAPAGGV